MITSTRDVTISFNAGNSQTAFQYNFDTAGYDYVVAHFISPTGTITFNGSNDGGAITGQTTESGEQAINFTNTVQGTNTSSGSGITSIAASGIVKFNLVSRYIQLTGTGPITKLILYFAKVQ